MKECEFRLTLCLLLFLIGCGYPQVGPATYEYAKALYAVCNQQDLVRLKNCRQDIEQLKQTQEIADREANYLLAIIRDAEQGAWTQSMEECRKLMEDQIIRK
ncbi:MAG: hypothetical protein KDA78_08610 [Planctomycetaceae bacterium]|nr:hypothetical protein [Planctomycetaceae bacterium]